jgi:hypothetical protein
MPLPASGIVRERILSLYDADINIYGRTQAWSPSGQLIKFRNGRPLALPSRERELTVNTSVLLLLALATSAPAALAFADDGPTTASKPAVATAAPTVEFAPMTASERFRRYLRGLVDPESVLRAGVSAGLKQAGNKPPEWGGGLEGYGYRYGDVFAQHVVRRTLQAGVAAVLHEDNRYFVSHQSGFFRRTGYALKSTVLARHDNGEQYFSVSRFSGAAGSAFLSRIWQPPSLNTPGDAAVNFGTAIGVDAGFNVLREFWPDLKHRFHKD